VRRPAGYSGTPLPKKLGIKPGMNVALLGAPEDFGATLGELPEGVMLRAGVRGHFGLVIWFVRKEAELARKIARAAAVAGNSPLWIAWPKKNAKSKRSVGTGPSEASVRKAGLEAGLVDYKVCAIDETWSGLLFARRKAVERM
jgi:hypothetical protein